MFVMHMKSDLNDSLTLASLIDRQHFAKYVYLVNYITLKNVKDLVKIPCHLHYLDTQTLELLDEFDIEDMIFDLIECSSKSVLVLNCTDNKLKQEFDSMAELYGLNYIDYDTASLNKEPDVINNPTLIDSFIVDEILEIKQDFAGYSYENYVNHVYLNSNSLIFNDVNLSLDNLNLYELFKYIQVPLLSCEYAFNSLTPVPYIFVFNACEEALCKLDNYKIQVFNQIKNLTPEDLIKMDKHICDKLILRGYIPLNKFKPLLEKYGDL